MVGIKFLGIVAFYFFAVREGFGQNFYPARYGKRVTRDSREDVLLGEKRIERKDASENLPDRKIRFFLSGGRYGKRGELVENFSENDTGPMKIINSGIERKENLSEKIRMPSRKNQFMMGSRFGKRMDRNYLGDVTANKVLKCIHIPSNNFFNCFFLEDQINESEIKAFEPNFFLNLS